MPKLYDLNGNYLNLLELLENPEMPAEMIKQSLESVEGDIKEKLENIAKLIKNMESDVKAFKEEEKRLKEKRGTLENRIGNLKEYAESGLKTLGEKKIKTGLFTLSVQQNPPSVDITDQEAIPDIFLIQPEPVVDKKSILESLKLGQVIEGVKLKTTESLRIR